MSDPVVQIVRCGRRWRWDMWWRGPSGGGPFLTGTTRTRWGARRKTRRTQHP